MLQLLAPDSTRYFPPHLLQMMHPAQRTAKGSSLSSAVDVEDGDEVLAPPSPPPRPALCLLPPCQSSALLASAYLSYGINVTLLPRTHGCVPHASTPPPCTPPPGPQQAIAPPSPPAYLPLSTLTPLTRSTPAPYPQQAHPSSTKTVSTLPAPQNHAVRLSGTRHILDTWLPLHGSRSAAHTRTIMLRCVLLHVPSLSCCVLLPAPLSWCCLLLLPAQFLLCCLLRPAPLS